MVHQVHEEYKKNLMSKSWEKCWSNRQMNKLDIVGQNQHFWSFGQLSGKQKLSQKNSAPSVFSTYGFSTSSKYQEKLMTNEQIEPFWATWPVFGQARILKKKSVPSVLSTLQPLSFIQNSKKKQNKESQSWEK